jgi:hypothetical protein
VRSDNLQPVSRYVPLNINDWIPASAGMTKLEMLVTVSFVTRGFVVISALLHLSSTPSAFAQLTRLKTSYSALTANMAAYWLAKDAKIFEKHGLSVDVVLIESGVTTVQALTAGETQIAMGGGTVAVSSNLAGSDIVSIASIESRLPYALLSQKDIKTIDQLKGKRLAISRFGSASDLAARLILQRYGLVADKDVTILQTGGTSTRLSALHKRSVDATRLPRKPASRSSPIRHSMIFHFPSWKSSPAARFLKPMPTLRRDICARLSKASTRSRITPNQASEPSENISRLMIEMLWKKSIGSTAKFIPLYRMSRPPPFKLSSPGWRNAIRGRKQPNRNNSSTARSCAKSRRAAL